MESAQVLYIETSIPAGMTIDAYRRSRPPRRRFRPLRHVVSVFRRTF